jgi:hypothetical protein
MNSWDIKRLWQFATAFRDAIVRSDARSLPVSFHNFPSGSCGDACLLLARFLTQNDYRCPDYIAGISGRYSHAWLETEAVIIDITVSQFENNPEALLWLGMPDGVLGGVLVTEDRKWYEQFTDPRRHPAEIDVYDESIKRNLMEAFDLISSNL